MSEYLSANYINSEHVSKSVWNLNINVAFIQTPYIYQQKYLIIFILNNLKGFVGCNSREKYSYLFLCSTSKNGSFHILNGGSKGDLEFSQTESTFDDVHRLDNFYNSINKSLKI